MPANPDFEQAAPDRLPASIPAHWSHTFDDVGNCNRCRAAEGTVLGAGLCAGWKLEIADKLAYSQAEDAWGDVRRPHVGYAHGLPGVRMARALLIAASCAISVWTLLHLVRWILP
jgi:hypothetical protein